MNPIRRVSDPRIDRPNRTIEYDLSEAPDAPWNRIIEDYDKTIPPFFIQITVRDATLMAKFADTKQLAYETSSTASSATSPRWSPS